MLILKWPSLSAPVTEPKLWNQTVWSMEHYLFLSLTAPHVMTFLKLYSKLLLLRPCHPMELRISWPLRITSLILYDRGSSVTFEGMDGTVQPQLSCCDAAGLQIQPPQDAAPEFGHSLNPESFLSVCIFDIWLGISISCLSCLCKRGTQKPDINTKMKNILKVSLNNDLMTKIQKN